MILTEPSTLTFSIFIVSTIFLCIISAAKDFIEFHNLGVKILKILSLIVSSYYAIVLQLILFHFLVIIVVLSGAMTFFHRIKRDKPLTIWGIDGPYDPNLKKRKWSEWEPDEINSLLEFFRGLESADHIEFTENGFTGWLILANFNPSEKDNITDWIN